MFQTNIIMAHEKINFLHSIKEDWWVLIGRTLCQIMEKLWTKMGDPLAFFGLFYILFILCLPNILNKSYHVTGEDKMFAQHRGGLVSVYLIEHCTSSWSSYGIKWGIPWNLFFRFLSILFIWYLSNISNKSYHDTGEGKLSAQQKWGLVSVSLI